MSGIKINGEGNMKHGDKGEASKVLNAAILGERDQGGGIVNPFEVPEEKNPVGDETDESGGIVNPFEVPEEKNPEGDETNLEEVEEDPSERKEVQEKNGNAGSKDENNDNRKWMSGSHCNEICFPGRCHG